MIVKVVGKSKRPYELTDRVTGVVKSGISYRLSLYVGEYETDIMNRVQGEGQQYAEFRCPEKVFDGVSLGDTLAVDLDDKKERIKSVMVQIDGGGFMPL